MDFEAIMLCTQQVFNLQCLFFFVLILIPDIGIFRVKSLQPGIAYKKTFNVVL